MTFFDFFNFAIQWHTIKGLAFRLLGIDFMVGVTEFTVVDFRISPAENVLVMVQVAWYMVYIGREDTLYG